MKGKKEERGGKDEMWGLLFHMMLGGFDAPHRRRATRLVGRAGRGRGRGRQRVCRRRGAGRPASVEI